MPPAKQLIQLTFRRDAGCAYSELMAPVHLKSPMAKSALTDLKASALDQLDEGVMITDARLDRPGPCIVYVNPAWERLTGYSAAEAVGATPRLLQGPPVSLKPLATGSVDQRGIGDHPHTPVIKRQQMADCRHSPLDVVDVYRWDIGTLESAVQHDGKPFGV